MKIATLTLHLPFNYGNALQQLALHKYLLRRGYETEVLSHWFYKNRDEINYYHNQLKSPKGWCRFIWHCLCFTGAFTKFRHETKIKRWLDSKIKWSREEGDDESFDTKSISHDVIIVGSDQIWNPRYRTSDFFLLPGFPDEVRRIAYAASFGTDRFIADREPFFIEHLKRFNAISVRESSAQAIVEKDFNLPATLVCDPTLLHTKEQWCELLDFRMPTKVRNELVVYLVTPQFREEWREAIRITKETGKKLHVFAFAWSPVPSVALRCCFSVFSYALRMLYIRMRLFCSGVRLHLSATPSEFVRMIAECDGLITDSFHGMMFATIFEKPCNVTIGEHEERQQMSARLRDFTVDFGCPEILTSRADVSAMKPLSISPKLQRLIVFSKKWIEEAIDG